MSAAAFDAHAVLSLRRKATAQQVRAAYRRLALAWHPDRNPDRHAEAVRRFQDIGRAYEMLSNPSATEVESTPEQTFRNFVPGPLFAETQSTNS